MKKIVLYSPFIGTSNVGDGIIFHYSKKAIRNVFKEDALIELPTQMPVSKKILNRYGKDTLKVVCGSNLLQSNMWFKLGRRGILTHAIRQWDISLCDAKKITPVVLLGCGWQNYAKKPNWYTKKLWKTLLKGPYIHSIRDDYTLKMLNSIGITNVVNTGCPTTWALTPEFCKEIPSAKAKNVITTITDYRQDLDKDQRMLEILLENYETVWLWLQGVYDLEYFNKFREGIKEKIILVPPQLDSYHEVLVNNDVDYIGTRLHGGIYAINQKKRAIIIGIDNRALEMQKDINLTVVPRASIENIVDMINGEIITDIRLPQDKIDMFLSQF